MSDTTALEAVGGALAALLCLLLALRVKPIRRQFFAAVRTWLRLSFPASATVTAVAGGLALWLLWPLSSTDPVQALRATASRTVASDDATSLLSAALQQPPATSEDLSEAPPDERKARALQSLRDFAARVQEKRSMSDSGPALQSSGSDESTGQEGANALPDVDTMMANLRARLEQNPEDLRGWMTLGWAYANTGKRAEAVAAYETARKLDPSNKDIAQALAQLQQAE